MKLAELSPCNSVVVIDMLIQVLGRSVPRREVRLLVSSPHQCTRDGGLLVQGTASDENELMPM